MGTHYGYRPSGNSPYVNNTIITDPQFNYVSLLLHGDGTNGAQNNTFVDSSTNNFTITRNGNTTQGSLSPYGSLWSNFFDGTGDYLNTPSNAAFSFGTGDFTVELWAYCTQDLTSGTTQFSVYSSEALNSSGSFGLFFLGGTWYVRINGLGNDLTAAASAAQRNTWVHFAVCRNAGTMTFYINGAAVASGNRSTQSVTQTQAYLGFLNGFTGYDFAGYMSNVRIVKGTAVYTSAFTPPTAPLTAISGTSLLTCQSNRFIDNSANNFTITRNGDVRVTKEAPFLPAAAYSTSTIGGSGYFDGTGDYLTVAGGMPSGAGTAFTMECWIYITDLSGYNAITRGDSSPRLDWGVDPSGSLKLDSVTVGNICSSAANTIQTNVWYHVVVTRSTANIYKLWVNGTNVATSSGFGTSMLANTTIGYSSYSSSHYFKGYISNFRVVTSEVYTATFTPPTTPLTAISGTSLLLNFTNAGIFDNAAENDLETVGNAQISTSVKKYGTGSIAFDGSGDRILVPGNQNLRLGSGNFTIEMWLYVNATSDMQIINTADSANYSYAIYKAGTNLGFYLSSNGTSWNLVSGNTFGTVNTGTWYHVALVRNGSTVTPYLNGVAGTSATVTAALADFAVLGIGDSTQSTPGASALNGYIDDLRITKSYARYTANFTPPTQAFPDQ